MRVWMSFVHCMSAADTRICRVPRYKLLLARLSENTDPDHPDAKARPTATHVRAERV
jgi:hypothetical protein